ncbi:MAG: signal peptidase II [Kiritimatiellaeota bacterium]|nr:signal peptidase II [Kiritimatiellota bacterium]
MHTADHDTDRKSRKQIPPAVSVAVMSGVVVLDQVTKALVCRYLPLNQFPHREIIKGFFALVHLRNTGAAWGFFQGRARLLTFLSFGVLVYLATQYRQLTGGSGLRKLALALLGGGIIGNLMDRMFRGEVVDFLLFYIGRWQWPAFNLADSAITSGVVILLFASLSAGSRRKASPDEET